MLSDFCSSFTGARAPGAAMRHTAGRPLRSFATPNLLTTRLGSHNAAAATLKCLASRDGVVGASDIRRTALAAKGGRRRKLSEEPPPPGFRAQDATRPPRSKDESRSSDERARGGSKSAPRAPGRASDGDRSNVTPRRRALTDDDLDQVVGELKRDGRADQLRQAMGLADESRSRFEGRNSGGSAHLGSLDLGLDALDRDAAPTGPPGRDAAASRRGSKRGTRGWVSEATRVERFLERPGAQLRELTGGGAAGYGSAERAADELLAEGGARGRDRDARGRTGRSGAPPTRRPDAQAARPRGGEAAEGGDWGRSGGQGPEGRRARPADGGRDFRGGTKRGAARAGGVAHRQLDGTVPIYKRDFQDLNEQTAAWRLFDVWVSLKDDPGKDHVGPSPALARKLERILGVEGEVPIRESAITVLRKAFDPRLSETGQTSFAYTVLVDHKAAVKAGASLRHKPGKQERVFVDELAVLLRTNSESVVRPRQQSPPRPPPPPPSAAKPVVVVGSGPAGLFAALTLAEAGARVVLLERGKPVEARGRDIGALFVRRQLDGDSNLCYGEGGAGTWSDGKLTTKIGRNSNRVRSVLNTLHHFGAPPSVLVTGKPHIGTDRLVVILRRFREHLAALGCDIRFGARVKGLAESGGRVTGVVMESGDVVEADKVVLAPGHSARDLYEHLVGHGVELRPKPFALGLRIEHPQELIDRIQYGDAVAAEVERGKGKVPVADYKLSSRVEVDLLKDREGLEARLNGHDWLSDDSARLPSWGQSERDTPLERRGVYSFCMCPGGQIVPTATSADELCINGMSFSRRNSKWANSALVAGVLQSDYSALQEEQGVLAGMEFQRRLERRAAQMGGGGCVAPVQRAHDFLDGRVSSTVPPSSYRLGVKSAPLHELFPFGITEALRHALLSFDRRMAGFLDDDALLHGVETRTSSPVTIVRDTQCESISMRGLFPCGEGAGYAGGIMSAAVDGIRVAEAVLGLAAAGGVDGGSDRVESDLPTKDSMMY